MHKSEQPAFEAIMMIINSDSPPKVAQDSSIKVNALIEKINNKKSDDVKKDLQSVLKEYLNCFWFYRDKRVEISKKMHKIGEILCEKYECQCKFDGENYYSDCPNILLHHDFGFSMRGTEKYLCSICGKEPLECEHITNNIYNEVTCNSIDGTCNICLRNFEECDHIENEKYNNVVATKIVHEIDLVTFDVVKDPEMVYTRITKIPYSKELILESLKNDFEFNKFTYGESPLFCLHCVQCSGYDPKKTELLFNKKA
ncbi:MAG: hypothetical protein R3331_01520 [Sulfurospirillaceae bacterium]|nr:hypothetical protein [Sulfurospirillaceae bacterium]